MKEKDHESTVNTSIMTELEIDALDDSLERRNGSLTDDDDDDDNNDNFYKTNTDYQKNNHLELEKVLSSLSNEKGTDGCEFETVPLEDGALEHEHEHEHEHSEPVLELTFSNEENTFSLRVRKSILDQ